MIVEKSKQSTPQEPLTASLDDTAMPESDGASEAGSATLSVESDGSVEHEPIDAPAAPADALAAPADALAAPAPADASTPAALDDTPVTGSDTAAPATVDDAAADVLAQLLEIRRNVVAFRKGLEDLKTEHAHAEKESELKIRLEEQRLNTLTTALNKSLLV